MLCGFRYGEQRFAIAILCKLAIYKTFWTYNIPRISWQQSDLGGGVGSYDNSGEGEGLERIRGEGGEDEGGEGEGGEGEGDEGEGVERGGDESKERVKGVEVTIVRVEVIRLKVEKMKAEVEKM